MSKVRKKEKKQWKKLIYKGVPILIGFTFGIFLSHYSRGMVRAGKISSDVDAVLSVLLLAGVLAAFLLQVIIHEAGHLVFGLLTGYRFSSFRIGSMMWIKKEDKVHFQKMSLAGTVGQCIMTPPEWKDGRIPFVLYNVGGCLFNILSALICLVLGCVFKESGSLKILFFIIAATGVIFGLCNGIPMKLSMINNDGYNALNLVKDSKALHAFWIQMKIYECEVKGIRIKDMPEEWFTMPLSDDMKNNSMITSVGVFACNRLMDQRQFAKADQLMESLLDMETAMVGLHRNLLVGDRIYCELIGENRPEKVETMLSKEQKQFMVSMKRFPAVLRTQYAYALLGEKDKRKAENIKKQFEKVMRTYPFVVDIESEQELMHIAEGVAQKIEADEVKL